MKNHCFYLLITLVTVSCSQYPASVEHTLKQVKENRAELKKVQAHYNRQPEDSLKDRAACFLIAGMPYHYTVQDNHLDAFKEYLGRNRKQDKLLENWQKRNGPVTGEMKIIPNLYQVTSAFLIGNIDFPYRDGWDTIRMNFEKIFVERCIGLPGDSLSAINGFYHVSDLEDTLGYLSN